MDEIIYNSLKEAYLRASEIGETEIAKSIYQIVYDNIDWWERDEDEYNNIREVVCYFKEVLIPKWKMIDHRKTKEKIVPFSIHNLPIPEQSFLLKMAK